MVHGYFRFDIANFRLSFGMFPQEFAIKMYKVRTTRDGSMDPCGNRSRRDQILVAQAAPKESSPGGAKSEANVAGILFSSEMIAH